MQPDGSSVPAGCRAGRTSGKWQHLKLQALSTSLVQWAVHGEGVSGKTSECLEGGRRAGTGRKPPKLFRCATWKAGSSWLLSESFHEHLTYAILLQEHRVIRNGVSDFMTLTMATSRAHSLTRAHVCTHAHSWLKIKFKAIKELCSLVLQASQGAGKMINAHFGALDGNHYPLQQRHSDITMTTTERLPSSVAKTIEILIKAIPFFLLTNGRKTSTKCYPEIQDQEHFPNSKFLLLSTESHDLHPQSCPPALSTTHIL